MTGIVLYPTAVLALVLCFPTRPEIVAATWGILAAGDGFATLVGVHVRSARLPWNPREVGRRSGRLRRLRQSCGQRAGGVDRRR